MSSTKTILFHIDGDAFFASCEQATQMSLRGKPIAIGKERGIVTAYSYEAKKMGVTRALSVQEMNQKYPEVLLVSSDYRKYSLFSQRMKRIVARYSRNVEGSGIDECFADISSEVRNWEDAHALAHKMQDEICTKLGLTVSIGIGETKTIAKIASGMNKPCGITLINEHNIQQQLYTLPIGRVSGIGVRSEPKMHQRSIQTIGQFVDKTFGWVQDYYSKPYQDLHKELRGISVSVCVATQTPPRSISKIRAFLPATGDRGLLLSELSRNAEIVATKLARNDLEACTMRIGMKIPMKGSVSYQIKPSVAIGSSQAMISLINQYFDSIYQQGVLYRATFVELEGLVACSRGQSMLFEQDIVTQEKTNKIESTTRLIEQKFGNTVLCTAASLGARQGGISDEGEGSGTPLVVSHDGVKILYLPFLGVFT